MQDPRYSYMDEDRLTITPTMFKDMEFCPMIPWINTNLNYRTPLTSSMELGRETIDASYKENIARELDLEKPWRFEVEALDRETGLRGVIDIVAGRKELTIVEVKLYTKTRHQHFRNQLLAYVYLATKTIAPVKRAILVMNKKPIIDIPITSEHIQYIQKQINKLKKIIQTEQPPTPNRTQNHCKPCLYRKICPHTQT